MKPVAYINVEERKLEWAEPITWHTPTIAQMEKIPLYTHPAKTLTDEELGLTDVEISLIAEEFTGADGLDVVDFGRAILRKAQEK
jgi:hypothetical protein